MILVNEVTLAGKQLPAGVTVFFICSEFKLLTVSKFAFRHKKIRPTKGCAVLFGFQRTGGGYRESPLTFRDEKLRGLQQSFFNFLKDFWALL